jgi:hypothetical protein
MIRQLLPDALILGGAAALVTGLWWWTPWVAMVVLGTLCIAGGVFLERANTIRQERGAGRRTQ